MLDSTGAPIANADVRVGDLQTKSGGDGAFRFADVPDGSALILVHAAGFRDGAQRVRIERSAPEAVVALASEASGIEVVFTGDLMFGRRYLDPGANGDTTGALVDPNDPKTAEKLVSRVAPITANADFTVPNVETAFASKGVAHPSKPFVFLSPPSSVAALRTLGVDLASLANNHTYDFFDDGMKSTLAAIRNEGIATVGAGSDETEAYRTAVLSKGSVRLGIAAFCGLRICGVRTGDDDLPDEPPYQDAVGPKGGVAKLETEKLAASLAALQGESDQVAVILHAGNEYVSTPTPGQRKSAQLAIDQGAAFVVGHHPHVLQAFESHAGRLIAYSLGNLVFDQDFRETWGSVVLRVGLAKGAAPTFVVDPIYLEDYVPYPASGMLARSIVRHLGELSAPYGVTLLEEGDRGRILLDPPTTSDKGASASPVLDLDKAAATVDLESMLGPNQYLSGMSAEGTIYIGRDVLRTGSFEHELPASEYDKVIGWNPVSNTQHLVVADPKDGSRALEVCRDFSTTQGTSLQSAGRTTIVSGHSYSLCGCMRGNPMAAARAEVVYYDSIDGQAPPLAVVPAIDSVPTDQWVCGCREAPVPPGAHYVSVQLSNNDASQNDGCGVNRELHCATFDRMRLVEWEPVDPAKPLPVPNQIDYLKVAPGTGSVSLTLRTVGAK